jgi:hypothetical protein
MEARMKKTLTLLTLSILMLTFSADSFARGRRAKRVRRTVRKQVQSRKTVNRRQVKQRKRIKQGLKSGELTKGEASTLVKQQKRINKFERKVKSDGYISKKEEKRLDTMQDRASKKIFRKKHNDID